MYCHAEAQVLQAPQAVRVGAEATGPRVATVVQYRLYRSRQVQAVLGRNDSEESISPVQK